MFDIGIVVLLPLSELIDVTPPLVRIASPYVLRPLSSVISALHFHAQGCFVFRQLVNL